MSKKDDFKNSPIYKTGESICHLGKVLMDENSSMQEIAEAAYDADLSLAFAFVPRTDPTKSKG